MLSLTRAHSNCLASLILFCLPAACGDETDGEDGLGADSAEAGDDATDDGATDTNAGGEMIYEESFDDADGLAWPEPWQVVGTHIIDAEIDDGRARMSGANNLTARLVLPGKDVVDADITVVVEYENFAVQGYGFYARQNGGALQETNPAGQGYGVYAEGGNQRSLGLWKEIDGVETPIVEVPDAVPGGVDSGTPYVIRFQCTQREGSTLLRAKMWREGDDEPAEWMVETEDSTPQLQDQSGSFANDVYNYQGTGSVWVHDVAIAEM